MPLPSRKLSSVSDTNGENDFWQTFTFAGTPTHLVREKGGRLGGGTRWKQPLGGLNSSLIKERESSTRGPGAGAQSAARSDAWNWKRVSAGADHSEERHA